MSSQGRNQALSACREDLHYLERPSRQVSLEDFRKVLETFRPSGDHAQEYREEQANAGQARAYSECSD